MIAMGVGNDDVRHRLAAHGIKQHSGVALIERPGIDDRHVAAADNVAQRPLEGERARIIGEDTPHARRNVVNDAGSEVESAIEWDVIGHFEYQVLAQVYLQPRITTAKSALSFPALRGSGRFFCKFESAYPA